MKIYRCLWLYHITAETINEHPVLSPFQQNIADQITEGTNLDSKFASNNTKGKFVKGRPQPHDNS